jgi:hypothetical protein
LPYHCRGADRTGRIGHIGCIRLIGSGFVQVVGCLPVSLASLTVAKSGTTGVAPHRLSFSPFLLFFLGQRRQQPTVEQICGNPLTPTLPTAYNGNIPRVFLPPAHVKFEEDFMIGFI